MSQADRPHLSQESRDVLEDLGLAHYDDRTDEHELAAIHVEPVTAS